MSDIGKQLAQLREKLTTEEERAQLEMEISGAERGIEKYRASLLKTHGHGGPQRDTSLTDTEPGRRIFIDLMQSLVRPMEDARTEALEGIPNAGRGVRPKWWWMIIQVPADKLAFLSIKAALNIRMTDKTSGRKATNLCIEIGSAVKMQTEYERWLEVCNEMDAVPNAAKLMMQRAKNMNPRQWSSWRRKIDEIQTLSWSREEKIHIGAKLLDVLIEHGGGYFELQYVQIGGKTERQVFLTDLCRQMIEDTSSFLEVNSPVLRPMLVKPRSWFWSAKDECYHGGYLRTPVDFIRGGIYKHTADLHNPMSQETLDACDRVGSVWYQINRQAFDLLLTSRQQPTSLFKNIPDSDPIPLPARKSDDEWDSMTKVERAEHKYERVKVHKQNSRDFSKRESALRKINIAKELMDSRYQRFCFPQKIDTRTRLYPIPPDLNPQGDSVARALLEFALSEPIGPRGLFWMKVKLANSYGEDKLTFEEMQTWVDNHYDLICDSVDNPVDGERFWATAEKELEFYAAAFEFVAATRTDNPEMYQSYQPCHQDGSNNGLQILSLLGRDETGARLTNCSDDPQRYDIYQTTADIVAQLVSQDAAAGDEVAMRWAGEIDRKVCKRACMTTPYGVTPRGIQDQLIEDGFTENLAGGRLENARYLRDHLMTALEQTVVASRPIMTWFQEIAAALAAVDRPLRWRTPAKSLVQQSYWSITHSDVRTVMGSYYLWSQHEGGGLDRRKQVLGSSPNVIHSVDASLLQMVVNELYERGIHSFSTIHDSFAVHYRHVDELRDVIRQVAFEMFKENWLKDGFYRYVQNNSPIELPPPPPQGDFDVHKVLNAPYFFS